MRILTDPLLRGRFVHVRRRVPPVDRDATRDIDVVLVSHSHHDHLDRSSLRRVAGGATVLIPRGARRLVPARRADRLEEVVAGDRLALGPIEVEVTHAEHRPGRILHRGPAAVGFSIAGTRRLYFAGDTDLFPGMRDLREGLDVALLPISGWGTRLGAGHLDPVRAARALTLLEPKVAIPIHWGTFLSMRLRRPPPDALTGPAERFAREAAAIAPGVDVRVLAPGEATVIE